jgi:hypothetical protein
MVAILGCFANPLVHLCQNHCELCICLARSIYQMTEMTAAGLLSFNLVATRREALFGGLPSVGEEIT